MSESEQYVTECAPVEVVLHALNGGQVEYWDAERAAKKMPDSKFGPMIPSGWVQDITHPKEWVPFRVYRVMHDEDEDDDGEIPQVKECLVTECMRHVMPQVVQDKMANAVIGLESGWNVTIVAGLDLPTVHREMHWGAYIKSHNTGRHIQVRKHSTIELFLGALHEGCMRVSEEGEAVSDD